MSKLRLYTAGRFHGNWRDLVQAKLGHLFDIIDPLDKELDSEGKRKTDTTFDEYTAWDLWAIRTADIVLVYSEATNPGQGYIVEAGYAAGLGKTVILVREPDNKHMPDRYLNFIDCIANYKTDNLQHGIDFVASMSIKK